MARRLRLSVTVGSFDPSYRPRGGEVRSNVMNGTVHRMKGRSKRPWRAAYVGPDRRKRSKTFQRKVDAERWLRDQLAVIDRGQWVDPAAGKVTFDAWSEQWLAGLDVKPKTAAGYRELLGSLVLPAFGGTPLARITPAQCRSWVSNLTARGLSASRVRQARGVLRQVLEMAVHDGLIPRNPVDGVKPPTIRSAERRYLSVDEVEELAGAVDARVPGSGLIVEVLAWVGLRWGELVALRRGRVDTDRRRITVAEAATEVAGELTFGSPKTHEIRTVTAPASVADALAVRLEGMDADDLVFKAPHGGPLRGSNWRLRVWRPALASTAIDPRLVPHELRHTAASLMIASGASIKVVQRQLGHASASMTLDRYGHLYDDDLDALSGALDRLRIDRITRRALPESPDS
jgi:integrase